MHSPLPNERFWIFKVDSWHTKLCILWVDISWSFSHPSFSMVSRPECYGVSRPECYGFSVSFKVWAHNSQQLLAVYLASLRRSEILQPSAPYYGIKLKSPRSLTMNIFLKLIYRNPALSTHTPGSQSPSWSHTVSHISIGAFLKFPTDPKWV